MKGSSPWSLLRPRGLWRLQAPCEVGVLLQNAQTWQSGTGLSLWAPLSPTLEALGGPNSFAGALKPSPAAPCCTEPQQQGRFGF